MRKGYVIRRYLETELGLVVQTFKSGQWYIACNAASYGSKAAALKAAKENGLTHTASKVWVEGPRGGCYFI